MNLKERLAQLKSRAEEIMPAVEAGDAAALKEGEQLAKEIAEVKGVPEQVAQAVYDTLRAWEAERQNPVSEE